MIQECKMCGGKFVVEAQATTGECSYCGTIQTLPRLDSERKTNLYDRANHYRRNNEFDRAMGVCEQILSEDITDAEAYWSIVLCRYGIEYVEDPKTHKRIPTINRTQKISIFADEDYKMALEYADIVQRKIYEQEANKIDEIQKGILSISDKEAPFDIFICYKQGDGHGNRTLDSVLAQDIYEKLVKEGYKVFFAEITLEDKIGKEFEPYIYAALNSAKVMLVIGTKSEHFNAVWVKNEWSRYLALIKSGADKILFPLYRDMDPYDLPEEFSHLQAQDMGKIGFIQDLIRGIAKIVKRADADYNAKKMESGGIASAVERMLKRGYMALEDFTYDKANDFFEQALNLEPECAKAYTGKALVQEKAANLDVMVANHLANFRKINAWSKLDEKTARMQMEEKYAQEKKYWQTDIYMSKAFRFAKGEFAQELNGAKQKILRGMEEGINVDSAEIDTEISRKQIEVRKQEIERMETELRSIAQEVADYQFKENVEKDNVRKEQQKCITIKKEIECLKRKGAMGCSFPIFTYVIVALILLIIAIRSDVAEFGYESVMESMQGLEWWGMWILVSLIVGAIPMIIAYFVGCAAEKRNLAEQIELDEEVRWIEGTHIVELEKNVQVFRKSIVVYEGRQKNIFSGIATKKQEIADLEKRIHDLSIKKNE